MYSIFDLVEDLTSLKKWYDDLSQIGPQPKWKLVVNFGQVSGREALSEQSLAQESMHTNSVIIEDSAMASRDTNANIFYHVTPAREPPILSMSRKDESCIAKLLECYLLPGSTPGMSIRELSDESFRLNLNSLHFALTLPTDLRSCEEEKYIEAICESYRNFCRNGCRSHRDLVQLLVWDWWFLNSTNGPPIATEDIISVSECHTIDWDWDYPLDFCL
jgi:hypothetical protein